MRGKNNGGSDALAIGSDAVIQTTGSVNLRPGGVAPGGSFTAAENDPVFIADPQFVGGTALGPFGFVLSSPELATIRDGSAGIVIGSATHTGPISANLAFNWQDELTLQNAGAGSAGITINSPITNPSNLVTLSSGGPVTQSSAAPITADSLLLHGTQPQSNFQLGNTGNNVETFASKFEVPKGLPDPGGSFGDVNYVNSGALAIGRPSAMGPLTGTGFDSSNNQPTPPIIATNSTSGGDFFAQTLSGNLTLNHNISTLASDITLVTSGVFLNPGMNTLTPAGGGRFLVFADTFTGEIDGDLTGSSPQPNLYGCTFSGGCIAGVSIPATGNHFVYRERPAATLTADNKARIYGAQNPAFTFQTSGLVNGDTLSDAVSGDFSTAATPTSNVGAYAITGSFVSPVGYALNVVPGTLTVNKAQLSLVADPQSRLQGAANPPLTGTVTGFVVGDTAGSATTGSLVFSTPADTASPIGFYAINGAGLDAGNYLFMQAPSNATALTVLAPNIPPPDRLRLGIDQAPRQSREPGFDDSYVYESNLGFPELCAAAGPLTVAGGGSTVGDLLDYEWARVRLNPNLSNCINVDEQNGCDDF
ncbi:MAG: MBG-2 domain-containing protein [Burkholderiales bacterium]|nr:MBG-2 domain-containing protein [Phycisphaerae bacterium]